MILLEIIAFSLYSFGARSFVHLHLDNIFHLLVCTSPEAQSIWMGTVGGAIFKSLQRCSVWFMSGLWQIHYRTLTELSSSHSCVLITVCFVIALLDNGRLAQSEILSSVKQIVEAAVICTIWFSLNSDQFPVLTAEKHFT